MISTFRFLIIRKSSFKMSPKNKLPDRWEKYSKCGSVINGTRFVPFKVPLYQHFCREVPQEELFTTSIAILTIKNLGLVIDLTFTSKYYNPQDFRSNHILHEKILCQGHGTLPQPHVLKRFYDVVDEFLNNPKHNGKVIGVHCTHGLNRTGYFICKYMVDQMKINPKTAIEDFEKARGHPMERDAYKNDICNEKSPTSVLAKLAPTSPGNQNRQYHSQPFRHPASNGYQIPIAGFGPPLGRGRMAHRGQANMTQQWDQAPGMRRPSQDSRLFSQSCKTEDMRHFRNPPLGAPLGKQKMPDPSSVQMRTDTFPNAPHNRHRKDMVTFPGPPLGKPTPPVHQSEDMMFSGPLLSKAGKSTFSPTGPNSHRYAPYPGFIDNLGPSGMNRGGFGPPLGLGRGRGRGRSRNQHGYQ